VILTVFVLAGCGSDGAASPTGSSPTGSSPTGSVTGSVTGSTTGSATEPLEALSGEEICGRLSLASVAADTGLDVTRATPDDSSTPQCAYEYTDDTGGVSNLTVASMRPEDVGGLAGRDAFDFVVQINESIAGDDAESQVVSAGGAAIRLSGSSLQLGVVQVGNRILTLIIPVDDVDSDAVDRLIATMATALD
jgi:hypothetical protein